MVQFSVSQVSVSIPVSVSVPVAFGLHLSLRLEEGVIGGMTYPAHHQLNSLVQNRVGLLVSLTEGFLPYDLDPPITTTTWFADSFSLNSG